MIYKHFTIFCKYPQSYSEESRKKAQGNMR